ncbi:hypothetical protein KKF61_05630, partial [Patescibacteria group bacterium]|nr:hypothetical protein [Patescibacteria group bacterium]
QKKNLHLIIILVIILIVMISLIQIFLNTSSSQEKNYYTQNNKIALYIDEYFLLKHLQNNDNKYNDVKITSTLPDTYYSTTPFKRLLNKTIYTSDLSLELKNEINSSSKNKYYEINDKYLVYLEDDWDDVMLKALYCDVLGYNNEDFQTLFSLRDYTGDYYDTHVYLSLLFLNANNCFLNNDINNQLASIRDILLKAQSDEKEFSDLFAERIVMLYWSGQGDQIKEEWIDIIKQAQNKDGGWPVKDSFLTGSNPHTTGLALLALQYYSEGNSKQLIYLDN